MLLKQVDVLLCRQLAFTAIIICSAIKRNSIAYNFITSSLDFMNFHCKFHFSAPVWQLFWPPSLERREVLSLFQAPIKIVHGETGSKKRAKNRVGTEEIEGESPHRFLLTRFLARLH